MSNLFYGLLKGKRKSKKMKNNNFSANDTSDLQENSWFKSLSEMDDDFENTFRDLTGVQLWPRSTADNKREELMDIEKTSEEEELKRKEDDDRCKRTRSAKHSMSEKKRRNRINQSLKILQELIPNCHKTDSVSVLDNAIEYLKALKSQVQNMSSSDGGGGGGGGGMFQAPYTLPGGNPITMEAQQFSPSLEAMLPSNGCRLPMIMTPIVNRSPSGTAGLSWMPVDGNYGDPQFQMPSQQLPGSIVDPSAITFIAGFSPGFNLFTSQEGYFRTST